MTLRDKPLVRVREVMKTRFDLTRAPVVERGEVIGIVSMTDLVIKGMVPHL